MCARRTYKICNIYYIEKKSDITTCILQRKTSIILSFKRTRNIYISYAWKLLMYKKALH